MKEGEKKEGERKRENNKRLAQSKVINPRQNARRKAAVTQSIAQAPAALTSIRLSSVLLIYSSSCSARTCIDTDAIRKLLFSSSSDCTLPFSVSTWTFSSLFSSSRRLYARSADGSSGEPGETSESRLSLMSLLLQLAALRLLQLPLILSSIMLFVSTCLWPFHYRKRRTVESKSKSTRFIAKQIQRKTIKKILATKI